MMGDFHQNTKEQKSPIFRNTSLVIGIAEVQLTMLASISVLLNESDIANPCPTKKVKSITRRIQMKFHFATPRNGQILPLGYTEPLGSTSLHQWAVCCIYILTVLAV